MKRRRTCWISAFLILAASIACTLQAKRQANPTRESGAAHPVTQAPVSKPQASPRTKTVKDEWAQEAITLQLYDREGIPFTTHFPARDFVVEDSSSDERTGVWFYSQVEGAKEELAYGHLFMPGKPSTVEAISRAVMGTWGLVQSNHWQVKRRSQEVAYPWARERIDFEKPLNAQQNIMGTVYIGEYQGKAFRVTEHFPADSGDGFALRASLILKHLQLR